METAIILAGGFGTRLREVVNGLPKPMAVVNGQPFLNYLFRYLRFYGIKKVILSTGYLSEKIEEYYTGEFEGMKVSYAKENSPLGTGGGIRMAMQKCGEEDVLVLNGDSFFDVDLVLLYRSHKDSGADASLALRKVTDASRYGAIEVRADGRITSFKEKSGEEEPGKINGGIYILNAQYYLQNTPAAKPFSIEHDFFSRCNEHNIYGFESRGYFIDIGVPEDYAKIQHEFKEFKYR